jgi:hypothetical protein
VAERAWTSSRSKVDPSPRMPRIVVIVACQDYADFLTAASDSFVRKSARGASVWVANATVSGAATSASARAGAGVGGPPICPSFGSITFFATKLENL